MRLPIDEWPVSQDITGVAIPTEVLMQKQLLQLPVALTTSTLSGHSLVVAIHLFFVLQQESFPYFVPNASLVSHK